MIEHPEGPARAVTASASQARWQQVALVAFLSQGGAGICQKGLAELPGEYRLFFLFCTYLVAIALSVWLYVRRRSRLCRGSVLVGGVAGLSCVLSVYFLLAALKTMPGMIVFVLVPASALGLTLLAGWLLFHERLSRSQTWGVALALLGIVLVQL